MDKSQRQELKVLAKGFSSHHNKIIKIRNEFKKVDPFDEKKINKLSNDFDKAVRGMEDAGQKLNLYIECL